jgi:hypothetical protein
MILQGLNIILILILIYLLFSIFYIIYWSKVEPTKYIPPDFNDKEFSLKDITIKNNVESYIEFETKDNFEGLISFGVNSIEPFEINWGNGMVIYYLGSSFNQILPPTNYRSGKYKIGINGNPKTVSLKTNNLEVEFEKLTIYKCPDLEKITYNIKKIEKVEIKESPKIKLWDLPK